MKNKKILFIAMSQSIHTARWINQIKDQNYNLYLYPSVNTNIIHPLIKDIKICIPWLLRNKKSHILKIIARIYYEILNKAIPNYYEKRLCHYIKRIKPDIIHTLETQNAGYLLYKIKEQYFKNKPFPVWWHTNWGSDIYLFGRLKRHKEKIRQVLSQCDYYSCECNRDVILAKDFGFNKTVFQVYPNTGGFDLCKLKNIKKELKKSSERKIIMLKGYQGWAGRALVALRALNIIKNLLLDYKIIIYSFVEDSVEIACELFNNETDIDIEIIPTDTSHEEILKYHGMARLSIGLSISDSISTSVLEAMAMGSFPIQSWTSAADEWIKDGETGLLVPPEDPDIVAKAIFKALTDDELVDKAAEVNWETVKKRLNFNDLKEKTINSYNSIFKEITSSK